MIALFVLKLSAGITLMWWLMPRKEVTDGFFRIQMRVLLGLAVLTALLLTSVQTWTPVNAVSEPGTERAGTDEAALPTIAIADAVWTASWIQGIAVAVAMISYAGSIFWALGRRLPGNLCIYALTLLCVAALTLHAIHVPNESSFVQQLLSDFSSAAVLGAVLTGMLLGHWYLTTPTMSINPLWWFNRTILIAAGLRLAASVWAVLASATPLNDSTQLIWLSIRWVGGIVTPVLVAVTVWRILKHRNTQSATGVLFAGLVLVFMGEMTAALLERDTFVPY